MQSAFWRQELRSLVLESNTELDLWFDGNRKRELSTYVALCGSIVQFSTKEWELPVRINRF